MNPDNTPTKVSEIKPEPTVKSDPSTTVIKPVITETITILTKRNQPLTASVYLPPDINLKNSENNDTVNKHKTSNDLNSDKSTSKNLTTENNASNQRNRRIKHAVMIAPATGIKRQFYHSFATHLAKHSIGVITFDNEGIGESLTSPLPKCDASLISWGRYDMPAVLDALQDEFPEAHYHLVGHSAGGQLVGLMENHDTLSSIFNVACSSGRIKNMDYPFKAQAMIFMDMAIPAGNLLLGYTPSDKLGMGEPLPRGVAKQWRDWCNGAGYVKTAFGKTIFTHYYDDITTPSKWLNFTDDDIANAKNVADMTRVFTNMPVEQLMIEPKQYYLSQIGHMKYFSSKTHSKAPQLWQMAIDWIEKH